MHAHTKTMTQVYERHQPALRQGACRQYEIRTRIRWGKLCMTISKCVINSQQHHAKASEAHVMAQSYG